MNESLFAALLGIVQGLTEFLPVSSSGHLSLLSFWFPGSELGTEQVARNLVLHLGTLVPVLVIYRSSLWGIARDATSGDIPLKERGGVRLLAWMVIGSIPTAAIGLGFKEHFEAMFDSPWVVGSAFLVTGVLLLATRWIPGGVTDERSLVWWQALLIGVVQGLAITPGISRSGSTIASGLLLGLDREFAARFSFLLSVPIIAAAGSLHAVALIKAGARTDWSDVALGATVAAMSAFACIHVFLLLLERVGMLPFIIYRLLLGAALVALYI